MNVITTVDRQTEAVPDNASIATANATVFTLARGEVGFIQNLHTTALAVRFAASASTTAFHCILKGGTATDDGNGGSIAIPDHVGAVSVAAMSGSPRFIAWKRVNG